MTTVVLACCLGVVAFLLDESYRQAVLRGAEDQLGAVANGLIGAAVERGDRLVFAELGEQRLSQPDSGLYAYVDAAGAGVIWQSPTVLVAATRIADEPLIARRPAPGESYFGAVQAGGDPRRFVYAYTVVWEALSDMELTFWILADQLPYLRQLSAFRQDIVVWLGVAAAVFVAIQFAALRWGLAPVRRMAERIRGLESGKRRNIGDDYPRELSGLAGNLNRFIAHERANRDRYRRAMDDLAHSLKTPLAVLKNAVRHDVAHAADGGACVLSEQIERMESTVGHQLSRAAAVPAALPLVRVSVMGTAERIVRAVERAYADKAVTTELVTSGMGVRVDERDLMEVLGNLVENAFKYTRSRVRLSVRDATNSVEVWVEDDGDGIAPAQRTAVLERGTRADTQTSGQGIGLASPSPPETRLADGRRARSDPAPGVRPPRREANASAARTGTPVVPPSGRKRGGTDGEKSEFADSTGDAGEPFPRGPGGGKRRIGSWAVARTDALAAEPVPVSTQARQLAGAVRTAARGCAHA